MDHCSLMYFFAQPYLSPCQLWWAKNLADFFYGVAFSTPKDQLISFQMPSLNTLISLPPWPWTLLCPTFLTKFSLSRSTILSWGGTGIMQAVSHADYNMLKNDLGDFLMYKRKLYIPWSLIKTILWECHDAHGHFRQTHACKRWSQSSSTGHR